MALLALVVATGFGLWRRRTDGRLDPVAQVGVPAASIDVMATSEHAPQTGPTADSDSLPVLVDGVPLGPTDHDVIPATDRLTAADVGAELGERATLVQFSSAFCQPCRATRVVLAEVARIVPGVRHVEIDAESNLDLVRRLDVMRTPTTLLVDAQGAIRTRATGAPRRDDVLSALAAIV